MTEDPERYGLSHTCCLPTRPPSNITQSYFQLSLFRLLCRNHHQFSLWPCDIVRPIIMFCQPTCYYIIHQQRSKQKHLIRFETKSLAAFQRLRFLLFIVYFRKVRNLFPPSKLHNVMNINVEKRVNQRADLLGAQKNQLEIDF